MLLAFAAWNVVYDRAAAERDARRHATADARFAARVAARELDQGIASARDTVAVTSTEPGFAAVLAPGAQCSLSFDPVPLFATGHLDIVRADGSVACSSVPNAAASAYAGASWFDAMRVGPAVVAPVRDARTGKQTLLIGAPVGTAGFLVSFDDFDGLGRQMTTKLGGPRDLAFTVTASDGTALSRSTAAGDHHSRFTGAAKTQIVDWTVTAGASKSAALAEARTVSNRELAITLAGLALFSLLAWVVSRRIVGPIAALSAGVRRATDDPTTDPINLTGPREVEGLVDDFNSLIGRARREREATVAAQQAQAERAALEELLRRAERADEHERELRLLEERERIGRDLHDTVIQRLFATGMALESTQSRIQEPGVRARVASAVDAIDETIREVRSAIFDMEGAALASAEETLRAVVDDVSGRLGFTASLRFEGSAEEAIPSHVVDQMAATLREALTNAAKHGSAERIDVDVAVTTDIVLVVRDDGSGVPDGAADRGGLGLASMRSRAQRLGGTFEIRRQLGGGTRLEWRVPRSAP